MRLLFSRAKIEVRLLAILVVLAVLCLVGCSAPRSPALPKDAAASSHSSVVLVRSPGEASPAVAGSKAPAFELRVLPDGKGPVGDRLQVLLREVAAEPGVGTIVIQPARAGTANAVAKLRAARRELVFILAESEDEALPAEAVADLVVDLSPGSAIDPPREAALARGLCELARRVATGKARMDDRNEIRAALRSAGGFDWKVEYRVDPATGLKAKNHVVVTASPRK